MPQTISRDAWLAKLLGLMRPVILQRSGLTVPLVSVTADPHVLQGRYVYGQCQAHPNGWKAASLAIAPNLTDRMQIAATLAHEAVHAALPWAGHDWTFHEAAERLGLRVRDENGGTDRTETFDAWARPLVNQLPEYPDPAAAVVVPSKPPPPWSIGWVGLCFALFFLSPFLPHGETLGKSFDVWGSSKSWLAGPGIWAFPLPLLGVGLTDGTLATRTHLRSLGRRLMLAAPIVAALAAFAIFNLSGAALSWLQGIVKSGLATQEYGWAITIDPPHTLAASVAYLAAGTVAVFWSLPIALLLWFTRPISSFYRIGRLVGHTPAFMWNMNRPAKFYEPSPDTKLMDRLSRSNPHHVGRVLTVISEAARVERAIRGYDVRQIDGQPLHPRLLPGSGFIIEEQGALYVVAAGLAQELTGKQAIELTEALGYPGQRDRRQHKPLPLHRARIITVSQGAEQSSNSPLDGAITRDFPQEWQ